MFFLDGSILPHQRSGRLGHLSGLRRIITKRRRDPLCDFACIAWKIPLQFPVDSTSLPVFSFFFAMELRKDPITRSWVMTGDDTGDAGSRPDAPCPFCSDSSLHVIAKTPNTPGASWSARSVVHPRPLYHIEGEPGRRGDGLYDRMHSVGAHEVLVENPNHDRHLWKASDEDIAHFLRLAAERILDLKRDPRIKYVSLFKDYGPNAGQEFSHPTSQLTATLFVPRRVLYELRAGRDYFVGKERCVFCDIIQQEERQAQRVIEVRGDYLALGPYAPRVPYETWILPRNHDSSFERTGLNKPGLRTNLAALLRRTLQRVRTVTEDFHLVLHTSPSSLHPSKNLGYWKTIDDDYHWHIEIMPVVPSKAKSYTFKEVYYSPVTSETAVKQLREAKIEG
jgi:UDPglucose--hexose-1-phosphate uridylyltransferase